MQRPRGMSQLGWWANGKVYLDAYVRGRSEAAGMGEAALGRP